MFFIELMTGEWLFTLPWLKVAYGIVAIVVTVILYKLIQNVEEEGEPDDEKKQVEKLPWNDFKAIMKKPKNIKKTLKKVELEDAFYDAKKMKTRSGDDIYE